MASFLFQKYVTTVRIKVLIIVKGLSKNEKGDESLG